MKRQPLRMYPGETMEDYLERTFYTETGYMTNPDEDALQAAEEIKYTLNRQLR